MSITPYSGAGLGSKPLTNITPFTYRDGATFLQIINEFEVWLRALPGEVQTILDEKFGELDVLVNELRDDIESSKNEWIEKFDQFMLDVIDELMGLNDISMSNLIRDMVSQTRLALEDNFISRESPTTQFERAYFKKVLHHLPFRFTDFAQAQGIYGNLYPQTFNVDERTNELFVAYNSAAHGVVAIFDWETGVYKSCFAYASAFATEGIEIIHEGNSRYVYVRYLQNGLGKFDITSVPPSTSLLAPVDTFNLNMGINFTRRNGVWTVAENSYPIGFYVDRSYLKKFDDSFNEIGTVRMPPLALGGSPYKYRTHTVPKTQGICDIGGTYAVGMGGFYSPANPVTPYTYQGIRLFSGRGEPLADNLIDPAKMFNILVHHGISCTRIENEGVQLVNGRIVSLTITETYSGGNSETGGLLFMEEFSNSNDAIDFREAAVTWSVPNYDAMQYGLWPRQFDGKIYDPIENVELTSLEQIREMMIAQGLMSFSFYSSSVQVLGVDGNPIPAGQLVTIKNGNNRSFFVEYFNGIRNVTETIYPSTSAPGELSSLKSDTGWIPITLADGKPFNTPNTPMLRVKNGVTYIKGQVDGLTSFSNNVVGEFDSQYAPSESVVFNCASDGSYTARWSITPNGGIILQNTNVPTPSASTWFPWPAFSFINKNG